MKWLMFLVVVSGLGVGRNLWAQEVAKEAGDEETLIAPLSEPSAVQQDQGQRQALLKTLRTEIEPNLPKADVEKLNRSVQRLGSYRDEWSQQAQEFLIANASVAELYLFRYSMLTNKRLNERILKTLLQFSSFRFPQAVVAFADSFANQKSDYVALLAAAVRQSPPLGPEALQLVLTTWSASLSLQEKLFFLSQTCGVWKEATPPVSEMIQGAMQQAASFWEIALSQEVRSCLKGY